ncbi:MAG: SWIM zinc finger family protein [Spirochaetes bacterium]|nr:SWIM zinc finger family protein [Spirochaetota bacterium]
MSTTIKFHVQGSAQDPYIVTFTLDDNVLTAFCTCPAGENGTYCKHRVNILQGISKGIVSGNTDEVQTILSWLPGTPLESAINAYKTAEKNYDKARKELTSAKHRLVVALYNRN